MGFGGGRGRRAAGKALARLRSVPLGPGDPRGALL